jgi:hypothetical protein
LKIVAGHEDRIGGDPIAIGKHDDIAPDHLPARNALRDLISYHQGARASEIPQRFEHALGSVLLKDRYNDSYDCRPSEHQRYAEIAQHEIDCSRSEEEFEHRLAGNFADNSQQGSSRGSR